MWVLGWIFMTVPLFMFAAGFSNFVLWRAVRRAKGSIKDFYSIRARRLLVPTVTFIGLWFGAQGLLHWADLGGNQIVRGVRIGGTLPFGPLWFLGAYAVLVVACPATVALHRRYGPIVPTVCVGGAILVDVLRFGVGMPWVGWVNLALAWSLPHQLAYLYAEGWLQRRPRVQWLMCLGGLTGLILMPALLNYPGSIGGTGGDQISNINPPTLMITALALWQVGAAMLLRRPISPRIGRPSLTRFIRELNSVTLTIFLWHMTAFLMAVLLLTPLGLGAAKEPLPSWWLQRPVFILVPALILAGLLYVLGPIERRSRTISLVRSQEWLHARLRAGRNQRHGQLTPHDSAEQLSWSEPKRAIK
jgi:hypothetical protein